MSTREHAPDRAEAMIEAGMGAASVYSEAQIRNARRIWQDYRKSVTGPGAPPGVWAAAAEYAIVRIDFVDGVTQAAIARRYGVTVRALSSGFSRLRDRLDLMPFDPRYATEKIDDDGEEPVNPLAGLLPGLGGGDEEEEEEDGPEPGLPFSEVRATPEFEEDVRELVQTGRPFTWIVSEVARLHPTGGIQEYREMLEMLQGIWNTTPRDELNGRTPEEADRDEGKA